MRAVSLPYRQCANPAQLEPWHLKTTTGLVELPEKHPNWDATIDVGVTRKLALDGRVLRDECGLGSGARVRVLAGWSCENARSRSYPWRHDLELPGRFDGTVEFRIPAHRLASSVDLIVGVILLSGAAKQSPVAASVPGSWLWRESTELRLEDSNGRFPMEWTDFQRAGLPAEAAWYLDWPSQDWEAPILGALRLRLNDSNPLLPSVLKLPHDDPRRRILILAAKLDVAKQLVTTALNDAQFVEGASSYPEGSVGFCVRLLIRVAFPTDSFPTLRDRLRDQAGDFHVRLQAGISPFEVDLDE